MHNCCYFDSDFYSNYTFGSCWHPYCNSYSSEFITVASYELKTCTSCIYTLQCGPVNNSPPELNEAIREGNEQKAHELIQQGKDVNDTECVSSMHAFLLLIPICHIRFFT